MVRKVYHPGRKLKVINDVGKTFFSNVVYFTFFACSIFKVIKLRGYCVVTENALAKYRSPNMGLLPDTQNSGLRMRRECRERFPRHRLQRKPLVSDPDMHHGTCVTHVPWCMSGSLNRGGGENVPGIPGAYATHNITYLVRGPWRRRRPLPGQFWAIVSVSRQWRFRGLVLGYRHIRIHPL